MARNPNDASDRASFNDGWKGDAMSGDAPLLGPLVDGTGPPGSHEVQFADRTGMIEFTPDGFYTVTGNDPGFVSTKFDASHVEHNNPGHDVYTIESSSANRAWGNAESQGVEREVSSVAINDWPMERDTAQLLEDRGVFPDGTVANAKECDGWRSDVGTIYPDDPSKPADQADVQADRPADMSTSEPPAETPANDAPATDGPASIEDAAATDPAASTAVDSAADLQPDPIDASPDPGFDPSTLDQTFADPGAGDPGDVGAFDGMSPDGPGDLGGAGLPASEFPEGNPGGDYGVDVADFGGDGGNSGGDVGDLGGEVGDFGGDGGDYGVDGGDFGGSVGDYGVDVGDFGGDFGDYGGDFANYGGDFGDHGGAVGSDGYCGDGE
jgi:hypothetical protein